MDDRLGIVCFLWGDPEWRHREHYVYGPEYVNRLASMLERHCSVPYRLICCTDDPAYIRPDVKICPLPTFVRAFPSYYQKLWAFNAAGAEMFGRRMLMIDLDVVIVKDIAPLIDCDLPFKAWATNKDHDPKRLARFNTSFVLMDGGAFPWVLDDFDPETGPGLSLRSGYELGDQGWVSYALNNEGAVWANSGAGIGSFTPLVSHGHTTSLPDDVRIVFFNGRSSPAMAKCQAVPWVRDAWQ